MKKTDKISEKKNGLFLAVGITFALTIILTWLVKTGTFSGTELVDNGYMRLGLHEIFTVSFYGIYYFVIQVMLLLVIAGFYGVVSKTSGYQNLVTRFGKFLKGKEIFVVLITSLVIAVLTSFSSQVLVMLVFIPFLISVMNEMKMDKIVAFSCTFGSILIGVLGATYGTEVVNFFSYYAGSVVKDLMLYKVIIFVFAYITFNAFNILRLLNVKNKKTNSEEINDSLVVEKSDSKKTKIWPIITLFAILLVFLILGYVDWFSIFKIEVFNDLYTSITEFKIGEDFFILKNILGNFAAFGQFALEASIVLLFIVSIIISFIYGVKFDSYVENFVDGIKKFIKPILLVVFAYTIFVLVYWSPFIPTVIDYLMDVESKLAPFLVSFCGMIASIFNVDYGYTAYSAGTYFATLYPNDISAVSLVLTSIYGLLTFIIPTSVVMLFGLQYLNISYKSWFKHIWKFLLIMFVILEVIYFILL